MASERGGRWYNTHQLRQWGGAAKLSVVMWASSLLPVCGRQIRWRTRLTHGKTEVWEEFSLSIGGGSWTSVYQINNMGDFWRTCGVEGEMTSWLKKYKSVQVSRRPGLATPSPSVGFRRKGRLLQQWWNLQANTGTVLKSNSFFQCLRLCHNSNFQSWSWRISAADEWEKKPLGGHGGTLASTTNFMIFFYRLFFLNSFFFLLWNNIQKKKMDVRMSCRNTDIDSRYITGVYSRESAFNPKT